MLHDPEAIANWPMTLSRDGARTPMPWVSSEANAGFTSGEPWLPVGAENMPRAVDLQENDDESLLQHTRAMLQLRREHAALRLGQVSRCDEDGDLFILERTYDGQTLRCLFNLGEQEIAIDRALSKGRILAAVNGAHFQQLPPYSGMVIEL